MKNERMEYLGKEIVDSCFQVHKLLGPGLLESSYQKCLEFELVSRGVQIETEKSLPLIYKDVKLDCGYRIDIVVENRILLELKSVEQIAPVHHAQVITYLKLSKIKLGYLINFNVALFKSGIKRFVNNY